MQSYTFKRHDYPLSYFYLQLPRREPDAVAVPGQLVAPPDYTFPEWQREDCWSEKYKQELIGSILKGQDLPKIYIGDIRDTDIKYIIDGGHRSRAIREFHDNEFHIVNRDIVKGGGDQKVYYDKQFDISTRNKRSLTPAEKKRFDDYHLDIVTYTDICENECRQIFNKLQNAKPMSIDDVINSWQSPLVDLMRTLWDSPVTVSDASDMSLSNHFTTKKIIPKPRKTSIMTKLISWFTIMNPQLTGDDIAKEPETVSMLYLTKGNNGKSPCLEYVKNYTDDISEDMITKFKELVAYIINYYHEHPSSSPTDMNTLIHSKVNHPDTFNINKYETFLFNVKAYELFMKDADKLYKNKQYDQSTIQSKAADELNNQFNKDLEIWFKSRKNGGNNPSGMRKRYSIVKDRCLDDADGNV